MIFTVYRLYACSYTCIILSVLGHDCNKATHPLNLYQASKSAITVMSEMVAGEITKVNASIKVTVSYYSFLKLNIRRDTLLVQYDLQSIIAGFVTISGNSVSLYILPNHVCLS